MDSISQLALGAAVGSAVLGRKAGYKAAMIGAIVATLPDLDVFIPMGGPVANFTYHRSFSHSLLVLTAVTPVLAWIVRKLLQRAHPELAADRRGWLWLVFLALVTHPLLDAFTIYGTQLFWPLNAEPVGLGSIFIIDPLYTLPLLIGVAAFVWLPNNRSRGLRFNAAGLLLSSAYLCWSAAAQQWVEQSARYSLADQTAGNSHFQQLLVQPAPFNTLLWRVLVMTEDGYREGFTSLLDQDKRVRFENYPSNNSLLDGIEQHWPVSRLQWFSKGFYSVTEQQQSVLISDLRMGVEPDYVFRFKVAERVGNEIHPTADQKLDTPRNLSQLTTLWQRIWRQPD
ncbi:MAG: metal-dependent hydrolase [Motiliproteus sp.]